jgi:hypothetical protein
MNQVQTLQMYADRLRDELASVEQAIAQLSAAPPVSGARAA